MSAAGRRVVLGREREMVAAAARRLASERLVVGSAGNLSGRAGELVVATPTGAHLDTLSASQLAVLGVDGRQVEGERPATSELELHLGIYRRFGAGAVVHTHSPYATALACVIDELPLVHYNLLALGGPIRVAGYATFGTTELANRTLAALEGRRAVLLASHGAVAYGDDVEQAVEHAILLEWVCEVYWRAKAIGTPRLLDAQASADVLDAMARRAYASAQRRPGSAPASA